MSFGSLAFTRLVKQLQERYGSRQQFERMERSGAQHDQFTNFETEFLADRDSFYWATVGSTGWPYVQHRGAPKGFLKVIGRLDSRYSAALRSLRARRPGSG